MVESEEDFLQKVAELARLYGWRVCHFRAARNKSGWATPIQFDAAGFPDLVLCNGERIIWVECKAEKGRLTPEQAEWIDALRNAGAEVYVWRPSDWPNILSILQGVISE